MQGQSDDAINFFTMPHIAGKRSRPLRKTDARTGRLRPCRVAGEQHHAGAFLRKCLRNRLTDAHRRSGHHDHFARWFHARLVSSRAVASQAARCTIGPSPFLWNRNGACVPLLPLFPLDVVLLPGAVLPLHIFEPRYREMIGECLANKTQFGVVRALEQGIVEMGCTAEITEVTKQYSDGRMDLISRGRDRFEILELNKERSFLRAEVMIIPDETSKADDAEKARALELHGEILALAGAEQEISEHDQNSLSFQLAGSLPLDLDFKQKLLATLSERERMHELAQYLETILPGLTRAARARKKAGGNGHAR